MGSQFSILAMIQQGYYATYPLLFISVVCLAIIFERVWALMGISGRAAKLADSLVPCSAAGQVQRSARGHPGARQRSGARLSHARSLRRRLSIATIWSSSTRNAASRRPSSSTATYGCSRPREHRRRSSDCSAPWSESWSPSSRWRLWAPAVSRSSPPVFRKRLISTALGLAVAIVAVIFFNYFSVKIQNINALLQINGDRLIDAALQGRQAGGR